MNPILEIRNLSFFFGSKAIFQDLNLGLFPGEAYAVLGHSGSGKSSLLKLVAGLIPFEKGMILIDGVDIATASKKVLQNLRTRIGLVLQEGALISNMSMYDNIALPLRYHTTLDEGEVGRRVGVVMDLLAIDRETDRAIPAQVSTGVRKRAALARALILDPPLLLLDEPISGLKEESTRRIVRVLKGFQERVGAALLFTTGEAASALTLANRVGLLEKGRISLERTPQEIQAKLEKDGDP